MPCRHEIVYRSHAGVELYVLERTCNSPGSDLIGSKPGNPIVVVMDLALLWLVEAADAVYETRFARSVRADDSQYLGIPHFEADITQCLHTTKGEGD